MILRKIAEAVREQNWITVVLEIMIVVVGIFIGLQVDDWNERRKDRVDEEVFLGRLHNDLMLATDLSGRLRARRIGFIDYLSTAVNAVFTDTDREQLTFEECAAIGNARFLNFVVSDMPSLTELTSTGRLEIIRDVDLRMAIIALQQRIEAFKEVIPLFTYMRVDLPVTFPELIRPSPYFDEILGEYEQQYECDLPGMRASPAFRAAVSLSMDGYDAYLRDGLIPWADQFDTVHQMLDQHLGYDHDQGGAPQ